MNRLDLVNRLIAESGSSGLALGSTANQRGDALNFVNWVDDAWLEIQGLANWPSLWEDAQVTVTAGNSTASGSLGHKRYVKDSMRLAGGGRLYYLPWDEFRLAYPTVEAGGSITQWTIRPDRSIAVNGQVTADTVLMVERFRMPGRFTKDVDEPELFSEHHMMIVWRALMLYAGFDEAGIVYKRGAAEYAQMKRLASGDLPLLQPGEALA